MVTRRKRSSPGTSCVEPKQRTTRSDAKEVLCSIIDNALGLWKTGDVKGCDAANRAGRESLSEPIEGTWVA